MGKLIAIGVFCLLLGVLVGMALGTEPTLAQNSGSMEVRLLGSSSPIPIDLGTNTFAAHAQVPKNITRLTDTTFIVADKKDVAVYRLESNQLKLVVRQNL